MGKASKTHSLHNASVVVLVALLNIAVFAGILPLGNAQPPTNVAGIIYSDTTWTKAGSPYSLSGPTAVANGVTLTIQPGVSVDLNGLYIQVNGTLLAKGTDADPIYFNGGATYEKYTNCLNFTEDSTDYDKQTGSGSIVENALASSAVIYINNASPKISNNSLQRLIVNGGFPIVTGNNIIDWVNYNNVAITVNGGAPSIVANSKIGGIFVFSGSPTISNNFITSSGNVDQNYAAIIAEGSPIIANNTIVSRVDKVEGHALFGGTYVYPGIIINGVPHIYGNLISGCSTSIKGTGIGGTAIVERNSITNTTVGFDGVTNAVIRNNTITNSSVAIQNPASSSTFTDNNVENNIRSVSISTANNVDVSGNWWGTTNASAINETMYDSKYDFNLGTINFVPFLNGPNNEAMPTSDLPPLPIPTPTTSSSPTNSPTPTTTLEPTQPPSQSPSPSQNPTESPITPQTGLNGVEIAILAVLVVIAVLLGGIFTVLIRKKVEQKEQKK